MTNEEMLAWKQDKGKAQHLFTAGENENWYSDYGDLWNLYKEAEKLIKIKIDPPHVPTIPLLSIYPKDLHLTIEVPTNSCLLLFYY